MEFKASAAATCFIGWFIVFMELRRIQVLQLKHSRRDDVVVSASFANNWKRKRIERGNQTKSRKTGENCGQFAKKMHFIKINRRIETGSGKVVID